MQCKKCGKECMESELKNGFCEECLKKYGKNPQELKLVNNNIANTLKILVYIIIIIGIILAIVSCTINLIYGILIFVSALLSALFLRALAEIIQLLEDIKNK